MEFAAKRLGMEEFGEFIAILWEWWNARNRFIFGRLDGRCEVLGDRVVAFVRSYRDAKVKNGEQLYPSYWVPPAACLLYTSPNPRD